MEPKSATCIMSLIHTCELCGANSFEYLAELQRHAAELALKPSDWMPWNYRETLLQAGCRHELQLAL